MVRTIIRNKGFLARKSTRATEADAKIASDLMDTFLANKENCVGMAANMIGWLKNIIVVDAGFAPLVMYNPIITKKEGPYETEEGCLCHEGERKTIRYERITVMYQDHAFKPQKQTFSGYVAQIIQHEVDHCNGIVI
ncbi:MAG: peptide deformylase [Lachnospiraceae bacterium]|nr:peptide deformylase [Lachnospiraceae bacterium]